MHASAGRQAGHSSRQAEEQLSLRQVHWPAFTGGKLLQHMKCMDEFLRGDWGGGAEGVGCLGPACPIVWMGLLSTTFPASY